LGNWVIWTKFGHEGFQITQLRNYPITQTFSMSPATAARMEEATDTEITLGTGKMLALFFGLVILCAVFFGMGFSMGKNSVKSTPELLPSPSQSGARSSTAKPATPSATISSPQTAQSAAANTADSSQSNSTAAQPTPDQGASQAQTASSVPGVGYFVQVAAVSKQEDAEALVESLKGRQYQAIIANQAADKLFHVQIGPFADIKEAEAMRSKLVSDGYNPILKK
jgi:DedD protein